MLSEDEGHRSGNLPEIEALRVALVRLKQEKSLSLTALAHDSHISRSTWNRVLKGESFPPRKEIERLSRRPRLDAQHLVGLWEAADAAVKRAEARPTAGGVPLVGPDGDIAVSTPEAAGVAPTFASSSTASAAVTEAVAVSRGDAPVPGGPPLPTTVAAEADRTTVQPVPADHGEKGSVGPVAAAVPPPSAPDAEAADVQSPEGGETAAAQSTVSAPAGGEIGVVRPVPVPGPTAKTSKMAKLLIALLALTVVLLIGRWAAMPDAGKDDTAATGAIGDTLPSGIESLPGDDGNTNEGTEGKNVGDKEPSQAPAQPSGEPTAGNDDDPQDPPVTGPDESLEPETSSGSKTTAPPAGREPQDKAPSALPVPTTATTAASLGAEGRTACAHYQPNRRVTLAKGMVGTNVAQVQCLLNHNYGYTLTEDGTFGSGTEAGVKAVQRCSGITVDGQVGSETWKYLDYPKPACGH
ncbi:peptidoglycan-binding protein [Streptomyces sp. NPDC005576]|uniref:peptidoglycan-binding protein n=1 Tax=Streptomyces sp. NPDC005576 TaxID=3364726 RepID=UPI0036CFDCA1